MARRRRKSTLRGARESDIVFENKACWVRRDRKAYTVFRTGFTHSTSDSAYKKTVDGLSIAVARCNYIAKRAAAEKR